MKPSDKAKLQKLNKEIAQLKKEARSPYADFYTKGLLRDAQWERRYLLRDLGLRK